MSLDSYLRSKEALLAQTDAKTWVGALFENNTLELFKKEIGASNYFWSFPSQGLVTRKRKIDELDAELKTQEKRLKEFNAAWQTSEVGREESAERDKTLATLATAESEHQSLIAELQLYKDNDPEVLAKKVKLAEVAKSAAIRWTDNIHTLISFARDKYGVERGQLLASAELEEGDLEDIE
ncbi:Meiotic nuclear division protein 1 [Gonapodya sp. JEL0774]|nr:Meiotic nuclear division protein 1 [Gonapodya sp. JEL0774]